MNKQVLLGIGILILLGAGIFLYSQKNPSVVYASLSGTVMYPERVALADGSVVLVTLQDVSMVDAPALVIASTTITTSGENVPIPYTLSYDPALIKAENTYIVRATISKDGTLVWTSTEAKLVIPNGLYVTDVQINVEQVTTSSTPPNTSETGSTGAEYSLVGPKWTWLHTEPGAVAGDKKIIAPAGEFVLSLDTAKRFTSTTDCNSLSGGYLVNGEVLRIGPIAATKKACMGETLESVYVRDLGLVTSYKIVGSELRLILAKDTGIMVFSSTGVPKVVNDEPPLPIACTMEAKACPDGSYVGRTGPNCEFQACPL